MGFAENTDLFGSLLKQNVKEICIDSDATNRTDSFYSSGYDLCLAS